MILDNDIENIKVYDEANIDRIFIDLEINGKEKRQGHLDTVISRHLIDDIKKIKPILKNSKLLVRINPIYENSLSEINNVIESGADIIMLPMFKRKEEVELFIKYVNKRAKICLLLETTEALARIDEILEVTGIDEIHIGLNDLHLAMGLDFMFELMSGGIIEYLTNKIKAKNIPFGIGGIACMEEGMLNGKIILKEHIRLGSNMVILSRTFKNSLEKNKELFKDEVKLLQSYKKDYMNLSEEKLLQNRKELIKKTNEIASSIRKKSNV